MIEPSLLLALAGAATVTFVAAEAADPTAGLAPYVGGGAGVIAVGALVEVTRRLLNGRLIPREVKDYEDEMGAAIVAAGQREADAMRHGEHMTAAAMQMVRAVDEVRAELASLRRAVEENR